MEAVDKKSWEREKSSIRQERMRGEGKGKHGKQEARKGSASEI